jgi:carboxymethylenebutenolidase
MPGPSAEPPLPSRTVEVPVGARSIPVTVVAPPGATGPRPAVLVIHEIFGPDAHIVDVATRFAREGYVGVAPNLFAGEVEARLTADNVRRAMQVFATGPPDLRRDPAKFEAFVATQPAEMRAVLGTFTQVTSPAALEGFAAELHALHRHLASWPEVRGAPVGAVGFCFGGSVVARLATLDPELRAGVIFYGMHPPLDRVGAIRAPLLGLYGGEDRGITEGVPALAEAMRAAGRDFTSHVYPGARHAFFNDTRPTYHPESAREAWERVRAFLSLHLA